MNQCLRCNRPCSVTSVFCDDCRSFLQDQRSGNTHDSSNRNLSSHALLSPPHLSLDKSDLYKEDVADRITAPFPAVANIYTPPQSPQTPPPAHDLSSSNKVEQAIGKLRDAARRIAAEEPSSRRAPRASRLAPLRDISHDIQRMSTPQPKIGTGTLRTQKQQNEELDKKISTLWPWLHDADEGEDDTWENYTDPLLARRFPSGSEAARIEEEDMRRALSQGATPFPLATRYVNKTQLRVAFIALVVMALLALGADSILVSLAFLHPRHTPPVPVGAPSLTLSLEGQSQFSNVASYGQIVVVHLRYFTPNAAVLLTHDVGETVQTVTGSSFFHVGANGAANVPIVIDTNWEPGFHVVEAEEKVSHFTASASLQIINAGPSRPSHLQLSTLHLDMGIAYQGANTIQPLKLSNSGNGAITWSASSDRSWLMLTPNQGTFSGSETIAVGAERATLKPGSYTGKITFFSNVGSSQVVDVEMQVRALPANVPVLAVTPPVLSFTALDGGTNPSAQYLVVSNPGSQPLSWSLTNNASSVLPSSVSFVRTASPATNWLAVARTSGTVVPGSTNVIPISIDSQTLLPGTYINTLVFSASQGTIDSPQNVSISLTVQPNCGLTVSQGGMSFIATSGQNNPSNQVLALGATSSCSGSIGWHATPSAGWLTMTPASGTLKGGAPSVDTSISVNALGLKAGNYAGTILIVAGQSTQSVTVLLTVQAPLPPSAPMMSVSQLSLNFSTTQGTGNPPGQAITIANTAASGGSVMQWHRNVTLLASSWLGASPTGGQLAPGQASQVTVTINTQSLTPGTYVGQITLTGTDQNNVNAGGSPQTITVTLLLLPPCSMAQPSSSALVFNVTQGGTGPAAQMVTMTATGNCSWPLNWNATVTSTTPGLTSTAWVGISPLSGLLSASGQSASLSVAPVITGLKPGNYTAQVSVSAADAANVPAQGSPQVFTVSLTILQPCSLQVLPTNGLTFTISQGQPAAKAQNINFSEAGNCARPVSWTATGSPSWLTLSPSSGTDNGTGSAVSVNVSASSLTPGTYNGSITITASGTGSAVVQGSPFVLPVMLVVNGFTVNGMVNACTTQVCLLPKPLANATVTLVNGSGTTVQTVTASASGNYIFTSVALGPYTVAATGTDSAGIHYAGSTSITVSSSMSNVTVNAIAGAAH